MNSVHGSLPTLTEVVEIQGDSRTAVDDPVPLPPESLTLETTDEAVGRTLENSVLVEHVMAMLQPRIDALLQARLQEVIELQLARLAEEAGRVAGDELARALHDLVARVVEDVAARRNAGSGG